MIKMLPYVSGDVRVTSPYGPRGNGWHNGIDLVGQSDKRIRAVMGGTVVASRIVEDYKSNATAEWGNYVAVYTPEDGLVRYYCHLSKRLCQNGDVINAGDHIGIEGSTGKKADGSPSSTGSHLHYEVRYTAANGASGASQTVRAASGSINPASDIGIENAAGVYKQPDFVSLVKKKCGLSDVTVARASDAVAPYAEDFWRKLYGQMV